jgi:hypothetical protein
VHLRLAIGTGVQAEAETTVLGYIRKPWRHVHLTEIDPIAVDGVPDSGYQLVNPLDHLVPYTDRVAPRVGAVIARDLHGHRLSLANLNGSVLLIAAAYTYPTVPAPGAWHDMPVSPALIRWRLLTASGTVAIRWHTAIDFRHTLPSNRLFWHVYARGSYQNFPQIGDRYYYRRPGRYLYILTPQTFDTRPLPNGSYKLTVQSSDICGKKRTQEVAIGIWNVAIAEAMLGGEPPPLSRPIRYRGSTSTARSLLMGDRLSRSRSRALRHTPSPSSKGRASGTSPTRRASKQWHHQNRTRSPGRAPPRRLIAFAGQAALPLRASSRE